VTKSCRVTSRHRDVALRDHSPQRVLSVGERSAPSRAGEHQPQAIAVGERQRLEIVDEVSVGVVEGQQVVPGVGHARLAAQIAVAVMFAWLSQQLPDPEAAHQLTDQAAAVPALADELK
jgi:predicted ATP-grasp superfamily ATP-dependent carboligase